MFQLTARGPGHRPLVPCRKAVPDIYCLSPSTISLLQQQLSYLESSPLAVSFATPPPTGYITQRNLQHSIQKQFTTATLVIVESIPDIVIYNMKGWNAVA